MALDQDQFPQTSYSLKPESTKENIVIRIIAEFSGDRPKILIVGEPKDLDGLGSGITMKGKHPHTAFITYRDVSHIPIEILTTEEYENMIGGNAPDQVLIADDYFDEALTEAVKKFAIRLSGTVADLSPSDIIQVYYESTGRVISRSKKKKFMEVDDEMIEALKNDWDNYQADSIAAAEIKARILISLEGAK
jgi:hypothetical protein